MNRGLSNGGARIVDDEDGNGAPAGGAAKHLEPLGVGEHGARAGFDRGGGEGRAVDFLSRSGREQVARPRLPAVGRDGFNRCAAGLGPSVADVYRRPDGRRERVEPREKPGLSRIVSHSCLSDARTTGT